MMMTTTRNEDELARPNNHKDQRMNGWQDALHTARQGWQTLAVAIVVWHERQQLAKLAERELRDMDIDPVDAQIESARRFFDIPEDRLRD